MRWPKFRFPIGFIVFDELNLIIFVSQGLTLSTASLVLYKNGLRSIGFGNRNFLVKDRFGELGDNENKAVVKTNKSDANPQDQLGHTLHPPG